MGNHPHTITSSVGKRTEIFNGIIALFIVHLDGLGVRAADAIADGITSDHNVLILRGCPAHDNASDQGTDMKRAWHIWDTSFWKVEEQIEIYNPLDYFTTDGGIVFNLLS